jgi:formylglycine-generating enzyme required for sulfatase activity
VERTRLYPANEIPDGMVMIPAAQVRMTTQYRNRECGFYQVPGQEPAAHPSRSLHKVVRFDREVHLPSYAMDLTPVTNAQYARFLQRALSTRVRRTS